MAEQTQPDKFIPDGTLFQYSEKTFKLIGTELVKARDKMGLTGTAFGKLCGWKPQRQCFLEQPGEHEIDLSTAQTIRDAINGN